MKKTEKTIADVKKAFGVFFVLDTSHPVLRDNETSTSLDFKRLLNTYFLFTFDEKVNFHHKVLAGEFLESGGYVKVSEKLYTKYAELHEHDERFFKTTNEIKESLFDIYQHNFEIFMEKNQNTFIFKTLKKEGILKNLLLKTDIGQKVNFLISCQESESLKSKTFDDLSNISVNKDYDSDDTGVVVPVDFERFANAKAYDAYIIHKERLVKTETYLYRVIFNPKKETLQMIFETPSDYGYNFHKLKLDENGVFVFEGDMLFFEREDAINKMNLLIEEKQKYLNDMRADLEIS